MPGRESVSGILYFMVKTSFEADYCCIFVLKY